jgi:hypothetical protein
MSKKTPATKKVAAKNTPASNKKARYLSNVLALKPQAHAPADLKQAVTPAPASASEATSPTPERRQPRAKAKHGDRVALAFRVSQAQYRVLVEMRLDERSSIQELLEKAVKYYFKAAHGTTFPDA